jgi:glycosyltransferase involved in cell wall biosynthesis
MDEVYGFIQQADVGIALLYPIKNYLTSLPVKAFEYMAAGKAFIMSDFPFWKQMFGECALFADPFKPDEIAGTIEKLMEDKGLLKKLGNMGKELIETKYAWEMEEERLFELYKRVLS